MKWFLSLLLVLASGCGNYDPCEDKACGETCRICDPADSSCQEPPGAKQCNRNGVCTDAPGLICG